MLFTIKKGPSINIGRLLLLIIAAALFIQLSCRESSEHWQMVIQDPRSGTVYYAETISAGDSFTLSYRHSVSRSAVSGTFLLVEDGGIRPVSTTYSSYGPGLPFDYTEHYVLEDGLITVYHDEAPRERIRLWVTPQTEETIYISESIFPLYTFSAEPLLLEIVVVRNYR